jgi:hypothetical protein
MGFEIEKSKLVQNHRFDFPAENPICDRLRRLLVRLWFLVGSVFKKAEPMEEKAEPMEEYLWPSPSVIG